MLKLILNKKSLPIFSLIFLQQVIVASSTYLLARAAAEVTNGHLPMSLLIAYLFSLFLPYFPGIAAAVMQAKWENYFHESFLKTYVDKFSGRVDLWRQKLAKIQTIGLISQELPQTAKSWTDYHFNMFSTALNVLLNIVTIGIVIESSFLWAFGITLILSAGAIKICSKHIAEISTKSQSDRIKLSGISSSSWNFVTLGNTHSLKAFNTELSQTFQSMKTSTLRAAKFTGLFSLIMVLIAFAPSLINVLHVANKIQHNPAMLAALLVVLPRLFLVLNYTYNLLEQIFDWNHQTIRVHGLLSGLEPAKSQIIGEIAFDKLRINKKPIEDLTIESIKNLCQTPGRLTVEGDNGSGKTTLLLRLKELLGQEAHYLPPFGEEDLKNLDSGISTGQLIHENICTLLSQLHPNKVLLLDEWNANLDTKNKAKINDLIDLHASKNCIVEIVHSAKQ